MRKISRPKCCFTGVEDGKPYLLYLSDDVVPDATIAGGLGSFAGLCRRMGQPLKHYRVIRNKIFGTTEALAVAIHAKFSSHVYLRELVRKAKAPRDALESSPEPLDQALNERYLEALGEIESFQRWSFRRQLVVSRSPKAVPWVTKEQIKAHARAQMEGEEVGLMEGESMRYTLFHERTRIQLGQRVGRPYVIDEAVALMELHAERIISAQQEHRPYQQSARQRRGGYARAPG